MVPLRYTASRMLICEECVITNLDAYKLLKRMVNKVLACGSIFL